MKIRIVTNGTNGSKIRMFYDRSSVCSFSRLKPSAHLELRLSKTTMYVHQTIVSLQYKMSYGFYPEIE